MKINHEKLQSIEELFLSILRVTILAILALALIISIIFALNGASNYFASPSKYSIEESNKGDFKDSLKNFLEPKEYNKDQETKESKQSNLSTPSDISTKYENEFNNQIQTANLFMSKFNLGPALNQDYINNEVSFALNLSKFMGDEDMIEEYIETQSNFLKIAFEDEDFLEKINMDNAADYFNFVIAYQKNHYADEDDKANEFNETEIKEATASNLQSIPQFISALTSFGIFLIITLILILIKIERNIRK